jgi:triphosphoribosyl-dephospho-CoA synthase
LAIGRAATLALYDELALSPKPGLVTLTDRGSHDDMDALTFMRSLFALRSYFPRIAALGAQGAPFAELERCGIDAESRMLAATGGVNTHRGSVFTLGLLCAAAGALAADFRSIEPEALRAALLDRWGDALLARTRRESTLPGGIAARQYGLRSASAEAALGFPVLFETALPAMQRGGACPQVVRLDALFQVIAVLDDANLAHRGGLDGLRFAQRAAREFVAAGGASRPDGLERAQAIGRDFVARRLSPGGAADMLAAACWMERVR